MGQITHRTLVTLPVLIFLVFCGKVVADSPGRGTSQPFSKESGDYVFVHFAGFNYENKEKYLENKAEFYRKRCKNREKITKHERRECESLDVLKRYPHTGVYHKDNPSKPVWWGGRCAVSYLTADANYVVQMGSWAGHVNQLAVRFCKRQKIIAQYAIKDLVDDENRLPHSISHFNWRDKVRFDNKNATLYIKTLDNNEYTFDVRTGKIIEYKYTPFKSYEARVFYKNKTHKIVRDITSCSGMTYATVFMGNGFPVHQLQIAEPIKKENGSTLVQTGAIPFEYISEARYVTSADQRAIWEITTPQGQSGQVMIDSIGADLCGKGNDGKEIKISMMEIASLKMSLTKPLPSRESIRTVDKRMSWDIKQWDKSRRKNCEETRLEPYKSESGLREMMFLYSESKCTDQSRNFVMEMNKANHWLRQQQRDLRILETARALAGFQLETGLPKHALDLYEYLLEAHQQKYYDRVSGSSALKVVILGKMLRASLQAGLLDEYKKYKNLYNIAYAETQKHEAEIKAKRHKEK